MRYLITFILLIATTLTVGAQTYAVEGLCFRILDKEKKTVQLVAADTPTDYAGNLHIPAFIQLTTDVNKKPTSYTVVSIATGAFDGCPDLLSVTLPETVTTVERNAITHCPNLHTVTFGAETDAATLGTSMFEGCTSLSDINYMGTTLNVLRYLKSLCEEQSLAPVIHCQPVFSNVRNVRPFNHISMTYHDSYQDVGSGKRIEQPSIWND